MADLPDYYAILQVDPNAQQEVIEATYRRLARIYHPDVNPSPAANQKMAALNQAYAVLSNLELRAAYDARREEERPPWEDDQAFRAEASSVKPVTKVAWWRWLLILPAAVLGLITAQIVVLLVAIILPDQVSQLVSSFMMPMGFVIFGTWVVPIKRTQVAGALAVIMLVLHGMIWGVALFSGWYETSKMVFDSIAMVLGIIGSLLGFYIAQKRDIRKGVGFALLAFLGVGKPIVGVAIFLGIVAGVWWPIGKTIIESPLWALLLIPAGLFFSAVAWWIQTFIYSLLVWPLVWLTTRLLEEKVE